MLKEFIVECHEALKSSNPGEVIRQIVLREIRQGDALRKALDSFGDGGNVSQKMFGCLVHSHRDLTIMKLKSVPHLRIAPHTHDMWTVIGCYSGMELNFLYRETTNGIEEIDRISINAPDAILLPEDAIHAVHNPNSTEGCAIHVYGGDIMSIDNTMWDPFTFKKAVLDVSTMLEYSFALMDAEAARNQV